MDHPYMYRRIDENYNIYIIIEMPEVKKLSYSKESINYTKHIYFILIGDILVLLILEFSRFKTFSNSDQ